MELTEVDPEVASLAFAEDLDRTWASGRPQQLGWTRTRIDELTEIVQMSGRAPDGTVDPYCLRLHASHYGPHPVKVNFVEPQTWAPARDGSRWFPRLESPPPWFGLHDTYGYPDGTYGQLVCFSFNLDYYISNHSPQPTEIWQQGRHTVAATLYRLHTILGPAHYRGPAAPLAAAA